MKFRMHRGRKETRLCIQYFSMCQRSTDDLLDQREFATLFYGVPRSPSVKRWRVKPESDLSECKKRFRYSAVVLFSIVQY